MEARSGGETLAGVARSLAELGTSVSDAELVARIGLLESLKNAAAAAQARAAVALRTLREDQERAAGRSTGKVALSVAGEVGLARRESPHRARTLLSLATILDRELPRTMAAFAAGQISEWRAMLVCRETACLSRADRGRVDAGLAPELARLSDREIVARAKQAAYQLDPHSVVERASRAAADRRVTIRPAPDMMAIVSALVPVAQGVALYKALCDEADRLRAVGDLRGRGQVMADTLVCRATGQASADAVGVEIQLVMTDQTLLAGSEVPARIAGYGPVPAGVARRLARTASKTGRAWVRRLYTDDVKLVGMESKRRHFPPGLRQLIAVRDEVCRTPWCGAPIRHADHVVPVRADGATSAANGQGLCEQCNQTKEQPGWRARPGPAALVLTTTPSGRLYASAPSPMVGAPPWRPRLADLVFFDLEPPRARAA